MDTLYDTVAQEKAVQNNWFLQQKGPHIAHWRIKASKNLNEAGGCPASSHSTGKLWEPDIYTNGSREPVENKSMCSDMSMQEALH